MCVDFVHVLVEEMPPLRSIVTMCELIHMDILK